MYTTLAAALSLLSVASGAAIGIRDNNPGCQAASMGDFEWKITGFDYHASYIFTTPAHQNSWGYVNFNVSNPALAYHATCSATSNQLSDFFYGTVNYKCTNPEGTPASTVTTFAWNYPAGKLDLNQTWTCSDLDPQYPARFNAYGTTQVPQECKDVTETNPDWQMGQIYSSRTVTCDVVDLTIKPYEMTAVA
ncbi:uncharacterized protein E0L32_005167 [Thyridium curvatum]|uniref:AA1-like domain-containing protein n=1 Tax=Thyridium curvatum TaxID=1093900 RepID=A0A507AXU1_9PEZI|nr:uncharacterized protein E0L32_005167 [Thyridium curvatum]TPX14772.1 hypothetical protein E0L32_005167 [Thyridium curvatum]